MANKVTMNICGQEYTLVADESAAYMEKVGALVDERMRQVLEALHVSQTDAAVLAAVNLADELLKNQAAAERIFAFVEVLKDVMKRKGYQERRKPIAK